MRIRIAPTAIVEPGAKIGDGTVIYHGAHVMAGARIGEECKIGEHCFVEGGAKIANDVTIKNGVSVWEGVVIHDGVFVGAGAVFTNDLYPRAPRFREKLDLRQTIVNVGATIGAGAVLLPVTIGQFAVVGAGAVVTRNVLDHAIVTGNPAGRAGWACMCGYPMREGRACETCGRELP